MLRQDDVNNFLREQFHSSMDSQDKAWVVHTIISAVKEYELCELEKRSVRIPMSLNEPAFTSYLGSGKAVSSLLRLSFMMRLNRIIEDAANEALKALGAEERGRRGCHSIDISSLDIDLKIRHLTVEELNHSLGCLLNDFSKIRHLSRWAPSPWWDHTCDLALLIGTFLHGFGNFENMYLDKSLPFAKKIDEYSCQGGVSDGHDYELVRKISKDVIADGSVGRVQCFLKSDPSTKGDFPATCKKIQDRLFQATTAKGATYNIHSNMPNAKFLNFRLSEIMNLIESTQTECSLHTKNPHKDTDSFPVPGITRFAATQSLINSDSRIFRIVRKKLGLVEREDSVVQHLLSLHAGFVFEKGPCGVEASEISKLFESLALAYISVNSAHQIARVEPIEQNVDDMKSPDPRHYTTTISSALSNNRKLRDSIFAALFCTGTIETKSFVSIVQRLMRSPFPESVSKGELKSYVLEILIPHCARLCVYRWEKGNRRGDASRTIHDKMDSVAPLDAKIPDPLLQFELHSLQSKENSIALLRRVKLHRALSYIFNQGKDTRLLCQPGLDVVSNMKHTLPIWWTSEFDWALLYQAFHSGILGALMNDEEEILENQSHLRNPSSLRRAIRHFFVGDVDDGAECSLDPLIPRNVIQRCSEKDIREFVERQIIEFPSALLLEKRLALLCSEICKSILDKSNSNEETGWAFFDLPMIDHDRWDI